MTAAKTTSVIERLIARSAHGSDPRRHRRVDIGLTASYLLADGTEYDGRLVNISAGGLLIEGPGGVAIGEPVTLRIDRIGHLNGTVARLTEQGFAVHFAHSRQRAARLADILTWIVNGGEDAPERRGADRFPQRRSAVLRLATGERAACEIVDISTGGAFVSTDHRPAVGTEVSLGRQRGTVVRHAEEGIGVRFASPPASDRASDPDVSD